MERRAAAQKNIQVFGERKKITPMRILSSNKKMQNGMENGGLRIFGEDENPKQRNGHKNEMEMTEINNTNKNNINDDDLNNIIESKM
jgi:hypothetical protein